MTKRGRARVTKDLRASILKIRGLDRRIECKEIRRGELSGGWLPFQPSFIPLRTTQTAGGDHL